MIFQLIIIFLLLILLTETTLILVKGNVRRLFKRNTICRKIFIDTSILIDGRILSVVKTGFIGGDLLIPRSVIRELQVLADGKDDEKRARARFGMDIANELERVENANVEIYPDELNKMPVDEKLLQLAKEENGAILTLDFNLGKVAATEKVPVLNLNDLVLSLRQEILAGEKMKIKITAEGSNKQQGVGYLSDGTMVVVENARNKVGKEVEIEFSNFLQTPSGKLGFAKLTGNQPAGRKKAQKN